MKKITLLVALIAFTNAFSQLQISDLGIDHNPIILVSPGERLVACDQTQVGNAFENGSFMEEFGQLIANDFDVAADETFTIDNITANLFTQGGIDNVDLLILDDDGTGLPGAVVTSILAVVPDSQIILGSAFGFDIHEAIFDISANPFVLDGGVAGTKYWLQIIGRPTAGGTSMAWETTTIAPIGLFLAFDNLTGTWGLGTADGVFTVAGDCSPTLSVNDNLAANSSIYPNPTNDVLNVKLPSNVEVLSSSLYNLLGQDTGLRLVNGTMNTSGLAEGLYILTVETSAGTLTQKVVKQ